MGNPHKHAALIKAWADGAVIEYRHDEGGPWRRCLGDPSWRVGTEYRVQPPPPHKWQKEMDAQAAGKVIQYRGIHSGGGWIDALGGVWNFDSPTAEYRIKPEEVVLYSLVGCDPQTGPFATLERQRGTCNLKLTFEEGKLIKAEVL